MFQIDIIATGSSGNCYVIRDGSDRILIDPGIPMREIQRALNFSASQLKFCLLSHEHRDHSASIKDLANLGVLCALSPGTDEALGVIPARKIAIQNKEETKINGWMVMGFNLQHDAAEPMGFLICPPSGRKICFATDTGAINFRFIGVTHWMIECNYSEKLLLQNKRVIPAVKDRIRKNHFELESVKDFFRAQDLSRTEKIYLIHLSDYNSDRNEFIRQIKKVTGKIVV